MVLFVTGADWRFKRIVERWQQVMSDYGYVYKIYDLGNLGYGVPGFEVTDTNFITKGFYNSIGGKWKSTGWWKLGVILDAMTNTTDSVVYLDADAVPVMPFAVDFSQFDIGVVRREHKPNLNNDSVSMYLRGNYNAGVIFLSNTTSTRNAVSKWKQMVDSMDANERNDQVCLSRILESPEVRVQVFDERYNSKNASSSSVIFHESGGKKGGVIIRESIE